MGWIPESGGPKNRGCSLCALETAFVPLSFDKLRIANKILGDLMILAILDKGSTMDRVRPQSHFVEY